MTLGKKWIDMMHDRARAEKAIGAVMQMDKIDIAKVTSAVEVN